MLGAFGVKLLGLAYKRQLDKQMELPLRPAQRFTEQNLPAVLIIAAQLRPHHRNGDDPDTQAQHLIGIADKTLHQRVSMPCAPNRRIRAKDVRRFLDDRKIIVRLLQHITDPLNRVVRLDTAAPVRTAEAEAIFVRRR